MTRKRLTKTSVVAAIFTLTISNLSRAADDAKDSDPKHNVVSVQHMSLALPARHLPLPQVQFMHSSGICIDPECSVIATTYHSQLRVGKAKLGVRGAHTVKVLSLASQSDSSKIDIPVAGKTLHYDPSNDIIFLYMKKPVAHKAGVTHSYAIPVDRKVKLVGYYKDNFESLDANIIGVNKPLTSQGQTMREDLILDV